ncbi:MAG: hypothetical protein L0H63_16325, partial [Nitrococcus sp.]|nr:hypothetical protein [Nitrococcus sp.]
IVSAGAVVNKSIPPYAQVAGNPARVVGWRKRPSALSQSGSEGTKRVAGDITAAQIGAGIRK